MKTVILKDEKPTEAVVSDKLQLQKYYVARDHNNRHAIIRRDRYAGESVRPYCAYGLTLNVSWDDAGGSNLRDCVETCLRKKFDVFEFDTASEMFKFLSDNTR